MACESTTIQGLGKRALPSWIICMSQATSSIMLRTGVQPVIFFVEQQKRGTFVTLYGVSGEISANEKEETKHMMIIFVNKQK